MGVLASPPNFVTLFSTALAPAVQINNTTVRTASFNPTGGLGSATIPAGYGAPNRQLDLHTYGTYQTPAAPGGVLVEIAMGSTTLCSINIAASVLATSSQIRELIGEANISYIDANTVRCNGWLEFEIAAGTTRQTFSTAASAGTPSPTATNTISGGSALPIMVYQTWTNAQAGQGTVINQVNLIGIN